MSERVSDSELTKLRDRLDIDDAFGWRPQILCLLNHIDALRAELTAARTVGDGGGGDLRQELKRK